MVESQLRNEILQGRYINLNGVSVGPLIVGDSAYPIFPWLLKPYQNVRNLDPTKVQFNTVLSKIRVIVERALGVLKGRWRCLRKRLEILTVLTENVPGTIAACCILHNICIENGEPDPDIDDSDDDDDFVDKGASANADAVRDVLRRNLLNL